MGRLFICVRRYQVSALAGAADLVFAAAMRAGDTLSCVGSDFRLGGLQTGLVAWQMIFSESIAHLGNMGLLRC